MGVDIIVFFLPACFFFYYYYYRTVELQLSVLLFYRGPWRPVMRYIPRSVQNDVFRTCLPPSQLRVMKENKKQAGRLTYLGKCSSNHGLRNDDAESLVLFSAYPTSTGSPN